MTPPAPGRDYLVSLLTNRSHYRVYPPVASPADLPLEPGCGLAARSSENMYFYVAGEVLVANAPANEQLFEQARRTSRLKGVTFSNPVATSRLGPTIWQVAGADVPEVVQRLEQTEPNLVVSPNHIFFGSVCYAFEPADYPSNVPAGTGLPPRYDEGCDDGCGKGVSVAVLDSGLPVDPAACPLLAGVTDRSIDDGTTWDTATRVFPEGHGAFVCGIIAQYSAASISSYLVLDQRGAIEEGSLAADIEAALHANPRVINLSLGTWTSNDLMPIGLGELQAAAERRDGTAPIVVAAAGNGDWNRPFWPAFAPWTISVGATTAAGDKALFSDWGTDADPFGLWVDVCADGVNVVGAMEAYRYLEETGTTAPFHGEALWSGTSFAAPYVSAVVANLLGSNGPLRLDVVRAALRGEAPEGVDLSCLPPGLGRPVGQDVDGIWQSVGYYVPRP